MLSRSALSLLELSPAVCDRLIWIWSVDKARFLICVETKQLFFVQDLSLPGLRFAAIHTRNQMVLKTLGHLEYIQPCAPLVQSFVETLLQDFGSCFLF